MKRLIRVSLITLPLLTGCAGLNKDDCCISNSSGTEVDSETVIVATINAAHGKRESRMIKISDEQIITNLDLIAGLVRRIDANFVALQEADEATWLTGGIDHVEHISDKSGWPNYVHSLAADSWVQKYGPAILTRHRIAGSSLENPDFSLPTINQSFVAASFDWARENETLQLTVISTQFDAIDIDERDRQLKSLVGYAQQLEGPYIIAGDFGMDWTDRKSTPKKLVEALGLTAYEPTSTELNTYGDRNPRRVDWILLSPGLSFVRYETREENVSDHRAVVAEVAYSGAD